MNSNNPFIQGQANLKFLVKARTTTEYNDYLFNQINIRNSRIILILNLFSPILYVVNVLICLLFVIVKFIISFFTYRWKVDQEEYSDFKELYFFFINHFPDRCKAAKYYEQSKFWIVSPAIDISKYNINGKSIVNYQSFLTKSDSFLILCESFGFLFEYIIKVRNICLIHKIWDFYEIKYSLKRIGKDSTFYFSNQSDKYALLFDQLKSNGKVLFQHGIVANWGVLPYRLNNITEFHSISQQTWVDAYNNLLHCNPQLVVMEPTIQLYDLSETDFSVLIVAEMDYINIECIILEELAKYNSIKVYLKKHPALVNDGSYRELQTKYGFEYITEKKFPKVNFVISYYSTLAYEYMAYDIPVYMYMTKEEYSSEEMLKQLKEEMSKWSAKKQ